MFQLINTTWLFAIAALSIPVVIHLWNIRPGKTLKVGSVALVEAASRKNSRSFNLLDLLLLLLRCLCLLVLAFLLAQPFWTEPVKPGKVKGWALIPKENLGEVFQKFKPTLDSLAKAGYEFHFFSAGFAKITSEDTTKLQTKQFSKQNTQINNWGLLNRLSEQVPATLPVFVFIPDNLNSFTGKRPEIALNLHLQTYLPVDSASDWIQSAALTPEAGRIKIIQGNSGPTGTTFSYNTIQGTGQRSSPYQINFNNGQPAISFKNQKNNIAVDTSTIHIAVYSDKNSGDAKYLLAALNAVKQFTDRKINIIYTDNNIHLFVNPDWIFWLRERKMPLMIAENIENIFTYEPGKMQNIQSDISFGEDEKTALYKRIADSTTTAQALWQDGFGSPILSVDGNRKFHYYHFYSRFDPAWNDIVWNDNFPKIILNLLFSNPAETDLHDRRTIDERQMLPNVTEDKTATFKKNLTDKTDLSKAFWIALILLFLMERLLAYRTKSVENYG